MEVGGQRKDKFLIFTIEYELFFVARSAEFLARWIKVVFVLNLFKEAAARWALPLIDNNDTNLDRYHNFMQRFRAAFDYSTRIATANWKI